MAKQLPEDLLALDGPDDWVSLFLNDVGEQLLEPEELDLAGPVSAATSAQSSFAPVESATRDLTRQLEVPSTSHATESSRIDELALPSLDDLLADSSDTDPEGLFSGFNSLSNSKFVTRPGQHLSKSPCGCKGVHSCCPATTSGSDNEQSSTAPQALPVSTLSADPAGQRSQQQHFNNANQIPSAVPQTASQSPPSAALSQTEIPSMAGLTAAQVADAIGFTGQHNSPQQPAATAARPFESPARGHRKRTRDLETNSAPSNSQAVHSSGAAGHFSIPSGADAVLASSAAAHSTAAADTSRSGSPGASSSAGGAPGQDGKQPSSSQDSAQPDEEQKRQARMQRNRESAHQSRQRKRMQFSEVEQRCDQLKQHNSQLNELVGRLTAENIGLKQQLVGICHQTGVPLPAPPVPAVMPFGFNNMGMPILPAPKVPIQRMPAARPAPAPAHQLPAGPQQPSQQPSQQSGLHHNSGSKAQTAQPQRSRKRAKQAAGAGTALLALFSFVVFLGPLGPLQGFSPAAQQQQMHTGMTETPGGALHSSGRVLMSLPSGLEHTPAGFNNSQQQQMNTVSRSEHLPARPNDTQLQLPHSSGVAKQGNPAFIEGTGENDVALPVQNGAEVALHGQAWWLHGANSSYDDSRSIMLRPSDKVAEQQALQGLKDLAPYAMHHSYWDQALDPDFSRVIMGSWQQALPGSADLDTEQSKSLQGFTGPSMCQQVFQSTAVSDSPMQARQRAQRHLAAGTSMRGSGSIALPPVQDPEHEQDLDRLAKKARRKTIGCGEDDPGVVVSVMLPSKTEGSDTEYTSLDQLYVVVLTPGVKYSTFSCLLPKPILV